MPNLSRLLGPLLIESVVVVTVIVIVVVAVMSQYMLAIFIACVN